VRHPERVEKLVLYGGFALGRRLRGSPLDAEQAEAMVTLMRTGWGQENPAFRQMFTSLFVPGGTPEQINWFNDLQRKSTSPENAVRIRLVSDYMNVMELLPHVKAPTLVLHCRNDAVQPFEEGRRIAAAIPGAHFVPLEGRNHLILDTDPGWPKFMDEVRSFLVG
jgi:pimeloyl-ACP methyl ester carboxylesterase